MTLNRRQPLLWFSALMLILLFPLNSGSVRSPRTSTTPNTSLRNLVLSSAQDVGHSFAGYDVSEPGIPSGSVTYLTGSWTVPTLNCSVTPNADVAIWVAIDAVNSSSSNPLIQPGIWGTCTGGQPSWRAIYEMYPAPIVNDPNNNNKNTIFPGDYVEASVAAPGDYFDPYPNEWDLSVSDTTRGWTWSNPVSINSVVPYTGVAQNPALSDAAWIVEAPSTTGAGQPLQLADFSPVTFSDNIAEVNGILTPGGLIPDEVPFSITQHDPSEWANASPFTIGNYTGFTVTYGQPSPFFVLHPHCYLFGVTIRCSP
jgi:hypothetical protein